MTTDAFEQREKGFENLFIHEHDVARVALLQRFGDDEAARAAYTAAHGGLNGALEATIVELRKDPERADRAAQALYHGNDVALEAWRTQHETQLDARAAARAPEEAAAEARWRASRSGSHVAGVDGTKGSGFERGRGGDDQKEHPAAGAIGAGFGGGTEG